jgi:predicted peroxiredoxin
MSQYVLIQSKSAWASGSAADFYTMAHQLAAAGHDVTLFLVQNGVLSARPGARDPRLSEIAGPRLRVLADDFSLRERAIDAERLAPGIAAAAIGVVVDLLAAGARSIWN